MVDDSARDDEIDINLRPAGDVAARLLALVTLARRGFLERASDDIAEEPPEAERFDLLAWLQEERLAGFLTPPELNLLNMPIGALTPEDTAASTWSIEGAAALAWALALIPTVPDFDHTADAASIIDVLPAPWSRTAEFRTAATLRDEMDIARARERAEVWHDRAGLFWDIRDGRLESTDDPAAVIARMADEAQAAGLIARPVHGDFSTQDGLYRDLTPDAVERLELIAYHRLVELNWLCGLVDHD